MKSLSLNGWAELNADFASDFSEISKLLNAPKNLILTLKIFGLDEDTKQTKKLLIKSLVVEEHIKLEVKSKILRYHLKAVIVHHGYSDASGHYFAITREED